MSKPMTAEVTRERVLKSVKQQPDGCWEWQLGRSSGGYGNLRFNGKTTRAHRLAYESFVGPITPGLFVLHKCDNPPCCNPDHLELGTHAKNMADMALRGRQRNPSGDAHPLRSDPSKRSFGDRNGTHTRPDTLRRGNRNHKAKLTPEQVVYAREQAARRSRSDIARELGVNNTTISRIVRGLYWK